MKLEIEEEDAEEESHETVAAGTPSYSRCASSTGCGSGGPTGNVM